MTIKRSSYSWFLIFAVFIQGIFSSFGQDSKKHKISQTNLLFIMYDDLRPDLSVYGRKYMVTPNMERLAAKSVTFDQAYCQVSVCNPSRDSMLTGLRPDTTGTYSFQWTFRPLMVFPTQLTRSGYNTRGIGKILHWETDPNVWNEQYKADWYNFQNIERDFMNSTTMPDKTRSEEQFRDHMFTTKTIATLRELNAKNTYFFIGLGLKLPHLCMHVPYKYYEMYLSKKDAWRLTEKERSFPASTPRSAYRCCAENTFKYMNHHGALPATREVTFPGNANYVIPEDMRDELMLGYAASISFLDAQLGRLLDVVDELSLWNNLTIVLTSDHGIHNGEKGLWEKWSMFDESTRVPLMIHHPLSPFKGQHYHEPVELLDIYPTLNDILGAPYDKEKVCKYTDPTGIHKCMPLQGKSLAPVILGENVLGQDRFIAGKRQGKGRGGKSGRGRSKGKGKHKAKGRGKGSNKDKASRPIIGEVEERRRLEMSTSSNYSLSPVAVSGPVRMPVLDMDFAVTQAWRCAKIEDVTAEKKKNTWKSIWFECSRDDNKNEKGLQQVSLMGYSMRTIDFRYTAWLPFNRTSMTTQWDLPPYEEELYDHRKERPEDFTHLELENLAGLRGYREIAHNLRDKLITYLRATVVFHGPYVEKPV